VASQNLQRRFPPISQTQWKTVTDVEMHGLNEGFVDRSDEADGRHPFPSESTGRLHSVRPVQDPTIVPPDHDRRPLPIRFHQERDV